MNMKMPYNSSFVGGKRIEESFGKHSISSKFGTYCNFGPDQISNQLHCHKSYEVCVIISGKGKFIHGNQIYKIAEGDIILAEPGIMHEIQCYDSKGLYLIYFFFDIISNSQLLSISPEDQLIDDFLIQHKIHSSSQHHILAYLAFIESYNNINRNLTFGTYHALRNLILESISSLSSCRINNKLIVTQNTIEIALDYIDSNLHKKISVCDVAKYCCTSLRNLQYLFQKHMNKTVVGYINEKKVNLACHYLSMLFSITDTAYLVGIHNAAHFSRLFKQYMGICPKKYQELNASKDKGFGRRL